MKQGTGRARCGFSLLEVLVVLAILGVIAGAVAPAFRRELVEDEVQKAARQLRQTMDRARRTAIDRGAAVTLLIDATNGNYWVIGSLARGDSIIASGPLALAPTVQLALPTPRGAVRFAPTGALASTDAIVLRGTMRSITLVAGGWHGAPSADDQ